MGMRLGDSGGNYRVHRRVGWVWQRIALLVVRLIRSGCCCCFLTFEASQTESQLVGSWCGTACVFLQLPWYHSGFLTFSSETSNSFSYSFMSYLHVSIFSAIQITCKDSPRPSFPGTSGNGPDFVALPVQNHHAGGLNGGQILFAEAVHWGLVPGVHQPDGGCRLLCPLPGGGAGSPSQAPVLGHSWTGEVQVRMNFSCDKSRHLTKSICLILRCPDIPNLTKTSLCIRPDSTLLYMRGKSLHVKY